MHRWRYHTLVIRDLSICEAKLNAEGEKGWELISLISSEGNAARAFFKMPIDEGEFGRVAAVAESSSGQAHWPGQDQERDVALVGGNPFELP